MRQARGLKRGPAARCGSTEPIRELGHSHGRDRGVRGRHGICQDHGRRREVTGRRRIGQRLPRALPDRREPRGGSRRLAERRGPAAEHRGRGIGARRDAARRAGGRRGDHRRPAASPTTSTATPTGRSSARSLDLSEKNSAVDPLTVCAELERRGELETAGGKPYVYQLAAAVPTAGNARHYAQLVKEQAHLRRLLERLPEDPGERRRPPGRGARARRGRRAQDVRGRPRRDGRGLPLDRGDPPRGDRQARAALARRAVRSPGRRPASRTSTTSPAASSTRT